MNEAAIFAARAGASCLSDAHLREAFNKAVLGLASARKPTSRVRNVTAVHEAGHAVVGLAMEAWLGESAEVSVSAVSILPRSGGSGGVTVFTPTDEGGLGDRDRLLAELAMTMGGRAAEELIFGPRKVTTGAIGDFESARRTARRMVEQLGMSAYGFPAMGDDLSGRSQGGGRASSSPLAALLEGEVERLTLIGYAAAKAVLRANEPLLVELSDALLQKETLRRADIDALLAPPSKGGSRGDGDLGSQVLAAMKDAAAMERIELQTADELRAELPFTAGSAYPNRGVFVSRAEGTGGVQGELESA
mmetsp:Transcript_33810/g.69109  ORF Transcript_33810/g.69109 Transcript_33810/m.69109 type:complete len:305 (-) Transcript_33810:4-918(-)